MPCWQWDVFGWFNSGDFIDFIVQLAQSTFTQTQLAQNSGQLGCVDVTYSRIETRWHVGTRNVPGNQNRMISLCVLKSIETEQVHSRLELKITNGTGVSVTSTLG